MNVNISPYTIDTSSSSSSYSSTLPSGKVTGVGSGVGVETICCGEAVDEHNKPWLLLSQRSNEIEGVRVTSTDMLEPMKKVSVILDRFFFPDPVATTGLVVEDEHPARLEESVTVDTTNGPIFPPLVFFRLLLAVSLCTFFAGALTVGFRFLEAGAATKKIRDNNG